MANPERWKLNMLLSTWQRLLGQYHREKGSWMPIEDLASYDHCVILKLALMVTEIAEMIEELRKVDFRHIKLAEELADIIIRTFDLAGQLEINLEDAMIDKMRKNEWRPFKHGKRF